MNADDQAAFAMGARQRIKGVCLEVMMGTFEARDLLLDTFKPDLAALAKNAALAVATAEDFAAALPQDVHTAIGRDFPPLAPHRNGADTLAGWPAPLDLRALAEHAPQPPRFIVRDWMPAGYATLLAGHGGVGKSAIGLHVATCIALGVPFFGVDCERQRVLYLSCEDRGAILHWRLHHLCAYRGIAMPDLHEALDVLDLVGRDTVLWERDPRTGYTTTPAFGQLAQRIDRAGTQVLVVDGVSDTFAGNENARPDVKRYVNALLSTLPTDGALLLLGHVNRPAASNPATSEGYSGSTQWHNAVRARWYLYPETEPDDDGRRERSGNLLLELQKSNLGDAAPTMSFRWDDAAHLFVDAGMGRGGMDTSIRDAAEQRAILRAIIESTTAGVPVPAAMQGPRTAFAVLRERPEFPEALKGGARAKTKRFARHLEVLRQVKHVSLGSIRRTNRHLLETLEVTSEGRAGCAQY